MSRGRSARPEGRGSARDTMPYLRDSTLGVYRPGSLPEELPMFWVLFLSLLAGLLGGLVGFA